MARRARPGDEGGESDDERRSTKLRPAPAQGTTRKDDARDDKRKSAPRVKWASAPAAEVARKATGRSGAPQARKRTDKAAAVGGRTRVLQSGSGGADQRRRRPSDVRGKPKVAGRDDDRRTQSPRGGRDDDRRTESPGGRDDHRRTQARRGGSDDAAGRARPTRGAQGQSPRGSERGGRLRAGDAGAGRRHSDGKGRDDWQSSGDLKRRSPQGRHGAGRGKPGRRDAANNSRGRDTGLQAPERLHRALSRAGIASRREAERMVEEGRISVNGRTAEAGQSVGPGDRVLVDGRPVHLRAPSESLPVVLRYHKPPGEVCSTVPQGDAPSVYDQLPRGRWVMVGRLDLNTAGLLLFTSDGDLANRLMHPSHSVEREYLVRIRGSLDDASIAKLRRGVDLEDGPARFDHVSPTGSEFRDADRHNRWYRVVLREGRNREVRRMFESVDATVGRLLRVRYGAVELPRSLRPGRHEALPQAEVLALMTAVGLAPSAEPEAADQDAPRGRGAKNRRAPDKCGKPVRRAPPRGRK